MAVVDLIDGTYELFRQFYGRRRASPASDRPMGAAAGVLHSVLQMVEDGSTHIGVATDHVIESFRNELWPGYKTGAGVDRELRAQFVPLEEGLAAMGVAVWPMVEFEADDALAAAARIARRGRRRRPGADLDARQGSRPVRAGRPGGAGRPAGQGDPKRRAACARSSASSRR